MRQLQIQPDEAGQRFDKFLARYLKEAPKSFLYKMLRKKNITLNGRKADGSEKLQAQDEVKLFLSDETIEKFRGNSKTESDTLKNSQIPSPDILLETVHVCLMNKPWGVLSQKAGENDISMNEIFLRYLLDSGQINEEQLATFRPAVCNRLDRNTTGIIIGGKTLYGLQTMSQLIREREIHKFYRCIVQGRMEGTQLIDGWLCKDERTNRVSISERERPGSSRIRTRFRVLASGKDSSLLEVELITGKPHQIRAHLAQTGHPVAGDAKYGNASFNERMRREYHLKTQLLHSCRLEFPVLTGDYAGLQELSGRQITAPLPDMFRRILEGEGL